jgi:hypothetical protein
VVEGRLTVIKTWFPFGDHVYIGYTGERCEVALGPMLLR